jgi:hypothetical protein
MGCTENVLKRFGYIKTCSSSSTLTSTIIALSTRRDQGFLENPTEIIRLKVSSSAIASDFLV